MCRCLASAYQRQQHEQHTAHHVHSPNQLQIGSLTMPSLLFSLGCLPSIISLACLTGILPLGIDCRHSVCCVVFELASPCDQAQRMLRIFIHTQSGEHTTNLSSAHAVCGTISVNVNVGRADAMTRSDGHPV